MKLYLIKSFSIDETVKENPPLSDKGIRDAKLVRLLLPNISFDFCFTSLEITAYGSAFLLVGDKMLIQKEKSLNKKNSPASVEKKIKDFFATNQKKFQDKNILIVADERIIKIIHKQYPSSIRINEKGL